MCVASDLPISFALLEGHSNVEMLFLLLSIPALVVLNGLFVAAEFSLVAIRKTRVEEMVHLGRLGAKEVQSAIERLDRTIAATQLGVTLASLGLGWLGEPAIADIFKP